MGHSSSKLWITLSTGDAVYGLSGVTTENGPALRVHKKKIIADKLDEKLKNPNLPAKAKQSIKKLSDAIRKEEKLIDWVKKDK